MQVRLWRVQQVTNLLHVDFADGNTDFEFQLFRTGANLLKNCVHHTWDYAFKTRVFYWRALHCVRLAGRGLSVSENGTVEALKDAVDNWFCCYFEDLLLGCIPRENVVELEERLFLFAQLLLLLLLLRRGLWVGWWIISVFVPLLLLLKGRRKLQTHAVAVQNLDASLHVQVQLLLVQGTHTKHHFYIPTLLLLLGWRAGCRLIGSSRRERRSNFLLGWGINLSVVLFLLLLLFFLGNYLFLIIIIRNKYNRDIFYGNY